jgi:hypothetical protein
LVRCAELIKKNVFLNKLAGGSLQDPNRSFTQTPTRRQHWPTLPRRAWIDDLASGRIRSFGEIAEREGKVERHIRLLTTLAFIPPRTLAAIIDGTGPHDATVTALAQAVPYRWDRNPAGGGSEQ